MLTIPSITLKNLFASATFVFILTACSTTTSQNTLDGSSTKPFNRNQDIVQMLIQGKNLYLKQEYSQAKTVFENVLVMDPNLADAHIYLGNIYFINNEFQKGQQHYQKALKLSPDNTAAKMNLSLAYIDELLKTLDQLKSVYQQSTDSSAAQHIIKIQNLESAIKNFLTENPE